MKTTVFNNVTFTKATASTLGSFLVSESKLSANDTDGFNINGRLTLSFDIQSSGFFTGNPAGTISILGRNDNALSVLTGSGVVLGPTSIVAKTWYESKHIDEDGNQSKSFPQGGEPNIVDGVLYNVSIYLNKDVSGLTRIKFTIRNKTTGDVLFSSAEIADGNRFSDYTKTGIVFKQESGAIAAPAWTIAFTNITATWSKSDVTFETSCVCPREVRYGSFSPSLEPRLNRANIRAVVANRNVNSRLVNLEQRGLKAFSAEHLYVYFEGLKLAFPETNIPSITPGGWNKVTIDVELGGLASVRDFGFTLVENTVNGLDVPKEPNPVTSVRVYRGNTSYYDPASYKDFRILKPTANEIEFSALRFRANPGLIKNKNLIVDIFLDFINYTFLFEYPDGSTLLKRVPIGDNVYLSFNIPVDHGQTDCCDGELRLPGATSPGGTVGSGPGGTFLPGETDPSKETFYITPTQVKPGQLFSSVVIGTPNSSFDALFYDQNGNLIATNIGVPLDAEGRFQSGGNYPPAAIGKEGTYYAEVTFKATGNMLRYSFIVKDTSKKLDLEDPKDLVTYYEDLVKGAVFAPVSPSMFNSLVSVAATMGAPEFLKSAILYALNAGDYLTAAASFLKYVKDKKGKISARLKAQRQKEMDKFLEEGYLNEDGEWTATPQAIAKNPALNERPQFYANDPVGFCDPNKSYPKTPGEPDTSRLARQERIRESIVWKKEQAEHKNVPIANSEDTWDQAPSGYNARYPYNKVTQSESGHLIELDDSPGSERLHIYHRKGTFWEVDNTGNSVRRTVGNDYQIVEHDGYIHISGNANVCVGGATSVRIENTMNVEIHGNATVHMHENAVVKVAKDVELSVGRDVKADIRGNVFGKIWGDVRGHIIGMVEAKIDGEVKIETGGSVSIRAGGDFSVDASNIHLNSGRAQSVTPLELEIPPITEKKYAPADVPPKTTFNRKEEAGAQFETPDDGTPAQVEAHKNKRVEEGTASRQELETPPKTEEKAAAGGNVPPKDVPVTVPTGREFRADDKISKYFTLGQMTQNYSRKLTNQSGTTPEQAFANMCYLATNVLDPLLEKYPNMKINSGYRLGNGASQHNKGEAVDISFPGLSRKDLFVRIQEVQNLVPYDQLLLEYLTPGGNGWIHISLAKRAPRKQAFTMVNHKRISNFGEFVQVA